MNKLLPILALLFFSCDEDPVAPAVGCENGAEYSETGCYCDDWQFIEDLFNCSKDECTNYLIFPDTPGIPNIELVNGRITAIFFENMEIDYIPESISNLTYITILDLSGNQLTSLPSSLCDLPDNPYIDVSNNCLSEEYHYDCIASWDSEHQTNCLNE